MAKPTPTIYDVAGMAGVSISTVSRVLNEPQKVNPSTRQAVLAAIDQLGFVPRADARARALKGHHRIGVITPFFTAPSFVQRLRGVAAALRNTPYELLIYTIESIDRVNTYLETFPMIHYLDGLIILSLQFDDAHAGRLVSNGLETVLVEYPHSVLNSVEIDDIGGGRLAAEYLVGKGHRCLGFVGDTTLTEFGIHPISNRQSGFRQGLAEAGIQLCDDSILLTPYDVEATRQKAIDLLKRPNRPTALFSATDLQAVGIMSAARDLGLSIPRDLAVLGFDNLDLAHYVGLTTISQHLDESGEIAAELLLSRIADPSRPVQHIHLPLNIIERETV